MALFPVVDAEQGDAQAPLLAPSSRTLTGDPSYGLLATVAQNLRTLTSAPCHYARLAAMKLHGMLLLVAMFLLFAAGLIRAQNLARPDVPPKIAASVNEEVVLITHASGFQIYVCQVGSDEKLSWTLKAPDAELADAKGKNIGHHGAGPSWKLTDGSEVTAKAVARENAADPADVPWLLLNVTGHTGTGVLAKVTTVQRIHTKGGQPPASGCDQAHRGAESKSPYTAEYYFYAPAH
jgi:Protein of unknown function (DUF3455)